MRGELDADHLDAIGSDAPDAVARDLEDHLRAILQGHGVRLSRRRT